MHNVFLMTHKATSLYTRSSQRISSHPDCCFQIEGCLIVGSAMMAKVSFSMRLFCDKNASIPYVHACVCILHTRFYMHTYTILHLHAYTRKRQRLCLTHVADRLLISTFVESTTMRLLLSTGAFDFCLYFFAIFYLCAYVCIFYI